MRLLALLALAVAVVAGVGAWVHRSEPDVYLRARYPLEYEHIIRGHAVNHALDPALLAAVVYVESRFDPKAESPAGAIGLMQLLPDTARGIAIRTGGTRFQTSDLYNPELNVRYGCWYLRHLLDRYEDEEVALAAYNAGQTNVDRWRREGVGIQFAETRHYVKRVRELKQIYRRSYPAQLRDTG